MLNKELIASTSEEAHVLMTVKKFNASVGDMDRFYVGWSDGEFGKVNRIPFWKTEGVDRILKGIYGVIFFEDPISETIVEKQHDRDFMGAITISINGGTASFNLDGASTSSSVDGDPFDLTRSVNDVLSIRFTPPLPDIYKKVKQVFTRSRKEGVVNAA